MMPALDTRYTRYTIHAKRVSPLALFLSLLSPLPLALAAENRRLIPGLSTRQDIIWQTAAEKNATQHSSYPRQPSVAICPPVVAVGVGWRVRVAADDGGEMARTCGWGSVHAFREQTGTLISEILSADSSHFHRRRRTTPLSRRHQQLLRKGTPSSWLYPCSCYGCADGAFSGIWQTTRSFRNSNTVFEIAPYYLVLQEEQQRERESEVPRSLPLIPRASERDFQQDESTGIHGLEITRSEGRTSRRYR